MTETLLAMLKTFDTQLGEQRGSDMDDICNRKEMRLIVNIHNDHSIDSKSLHAHCRGNDLNTYLCDARNNDEQVMDQNEKTLSC